MFLYARAPFLESTKREGKDRYTSDLFDPAQQGLEPGGSGDGVAGFVIGEDIAVGFLESMIKMHHPWVDTIRDQGRASDAASG